MKNTYLKIAIVLLVFTGLTSCTDWLTIQPAGEIVLGNYWKSKSDVQAVVRTCYRAMLEDEFMKRVMIWGELRSDNIIGGSGIKDAENQILQANIVPTNVDCQWGSFYSVINYCNTVLYYAPSVIDPNYTTTQLHADEAEVLTIRALCYFYLVRAFKNVPLVTDPSITDTQNFKSVQSTEDQVLDKLEADLIQAENWAMISYGTDQYDKGRITKNAVRALLADVYLWRNKYTNCITECDKIITDPTFILIQPDQSPYYSIFGQKNSTESIFELQFSEFNKVNQKVYDYYGTSVTPAGQFSASSFLGTGTTVYPITDVRGGDNFNNVSAAGLYHIFKYAGVNRTVNNSGVSAYIYRSFTANWIMYRLTDVMLMKAEALVEVDRNDSDLKSALAIVNTTYKRSNPTILNDTLTLSSYPTKQAMEELVLLERQRELMFEGKRWFDLLRMARRDGNTTRLLSKVLWKYTDNQTTIQSKMTDMNALYMPINQAEIQANSNLTQNPFYDTGSN